ncbi:O-antigen ligase family protein, partial [Hyalangium sp.]|uniref:O-antigen ligase family protein n=1 Tax=Hyalangium sp. TaxID=2028555 RepID=UPI002D5D36DA
MRTTCAGRAVLGALLVLVPLAFTQWTLEGFELVKVALLHLAALALVALGGGRWEAARRALPEVVREPLALGFLLLLVSAVASTAVSISRWTSLAGAHESFSGLPTVLGYTVLFFAARAWGRTPAVARALLASPVVASALVASYAWAQVLGVDPLTWERVATLGEQVRTFSTLGHPNHLAAFLAMAFPFTALWAQRAADLKRHGALGLLCAVALLSVGAVAVSLSRSGWLAMACVLGVLAVGGVRLGQRRGALVGGVVLAVALVVVFVLALRAPGSGQEGWLASLSERVRRFGEGDTRLLIWRAAWEIFAAHPVLGSGLDTFHLAFEGARSADYWKLEWNGTPAKAHNQALHLLATQGLLGGSALLVLGVGLVLAIRRAWRRVPIEERPLVLALTASVLAFATQNAFNFTVAATGTLFTCVAGLLSGLGREGDVAAPLVGTSCARGTLLGAAVLGMVSFLLTLAGPGAPVGGLSAAQGLGLLLMAAMLGGTTWSLTGLLRAEKPSATSRRMELGSPRGSIWRAVVLGGTALALAVVGILSPLRASAACRTGQALISVTPERAVPHLERAVALDFTRDTCLAKLGTAALLVAKTTTDGGVRRQALERARGAFTTALAQVPAESYHHANLGRLRTELARDGLAATVEAFAAYDEALRRDPANGHILADAALSALTLRDANRARQYAHRAVALYPDFAPPLAVLGFLALQEGNTAEAVRLLRAARAGQWRGDENARRVAVGNLVAALLRVGRPDEALDPAREVVALTP